MQAPLLQASVYNDPVFIGLVVLMLLLVLGGYLLIRKTLLSLREGFDDGYR